MRLRVRNFSGYCVQHSRKVANHVAIPEPDYAIPTKRDLGSSRSIRFFVHCMLTPIDLNYQPLRRTGEIGHVTTDWMLAAKAHRWKGFAKTPP